MAYPDYEKPFIVHTDACKDGMVQGQFSISAKMENLGSSHIHPVLSHQQKKKNYRLHSGKLELLALKRAIKEQFRDYLYYA